MSVLFPTVKAFLWGAGGGGTPSSIDQFGGSGAYVITQFNMNSYDGGGGVRVTVGCAGPAAVLQQTTPGGFGDGIGGTGGNAGSTAKRTGGAGGGGSSIRAVGSGALIALAAGGGGAGGDWQKTQPAKGGYGGCVGGGSDGHYSVSANGEGIGGNDRGQGGTGGTSLNGGNGQNGFDWNYAPRPGGGGAGGFIGMSLGDGGGGGGGGYGGGGGGAAGYLGDTYGAGGGGGSSYWGITVPLTIDCYAVDGLEPLQVAGGDQTYYYYAANSGTGGPSTGTEPTAGKPGMVVLEYVLNACVVPVPNPCGSHGTCVENNGVGGPYVCTCDPGWSGTLCINNINECLSNPCTSGGTCRDLSNGFNCTCPTGYSGVRCEFNFCSSRPCANGGTCASSANGYTCSCVGGFSGRTCETNINECASQPCVNGGTCVDGDGLFRCTCPSGYSGARCQTEINECGSQPCANGGTCHDSLNSYTCDCRPGFEGARCQTDVNECSSAPCINGGACVDAPGAFRCTCVAGYSGQLCQTNVNECASQPCVNGGTCVDAVNRFNCTCVSGYSGAVCQLDVNECGANNGGCGPNALCVNTFGSWSCVGVVDNTLASPPATAPALQLQLPELTAQSFQFRVRIAPAPLNPSHLQYTVGCDGGIVSGVSISGLSFNCTTTSIAPFGPTEYDVTCGVVRGYGTNLRLRVTYNHTFASLSNETISYPAPIISPITLRHNDTGTGGLKSRTVFLTPLTTITVLFDGFHFVPERSSVCFGPINPLTGLATQSSCCELDPVRSNEHTLACGTPNNAAGANQVFTVTTAWNLPNNAARGVGTDTLTIPLSPIINAASGCDELRGNMTVSCPTEGGIPITCYGYNLNQVTAVKVNNFDCTDLAVTPAGYTLTCLLPAGTGLNLKILAFTDQTNSLSAPLISYVGGTVTSVVGCTLADAPAVGSIFDCPRAGGGGLITVLGKDFGAFGANVLIGTQLVTVGVQHDLAFPHRKLTFPLPPGTGSFPVVVLQSGGTLGPSDATLSYHKCRPGEYAAPVSGDTVACVNCTAGKFSSTFDAPACEKCLSGTYSTGAGAALCEPCAAGRYSSGARPCQACAPGQIQSAIGQSSCSDCVAGRYSNESQSTECTACGIDQYLFESGGTACLHCTGIHYQTGFGQQSCQTCPDNQYRYNGGCVPCPSPGVKCTSDGIRAESDYFVYLSTSDGTLRSLPCLHGFCEPCGTAGAGGGGSSGGNETEFVPGAVLSCCSANRPPAQNNPLCGACVKPDYFLWGTQCVYCTSANGGVIFGLILLSWAYVTVFHILAQRNKADTRIFLNFIQFVYIFTSLNAGGATAWLSLFNFNVFQSTGGTCVAPVTDLQRLSAGLLIPLICFGFLWLNCVLHFVVWRLFQSGYCPYFLCEPNQAAAGGGGGASVKSVLYYLFGFNFIRSANEQFRPIFDRYRRSTLAFVCSSYFSVIQAVFTFFSCTGFEGNSYLTAYPSVSCTDSSEYNSLKPLFIVLMIVVVALPLALFARLRQLHNAKLLHTLPAYQLLYGTMFEGYQPAKYGWECVVLVRRLIVAAVALVSYPDDLHQKFTYLCLCNILFLILHFLARPYSLVIDNFAETLSLLVLTLVTVFLIQEPNPASGSTAAGLSALCFVIAILFVVRIAASRYDTFLQLQQKKKQHGTGPSRSTISGLLRASTVTRAPSTGSGKMSSATPAAAALDGATVTGDPSTTATAADPSTAAADATTSLELAAVNVRVDGDDARAVTAGSVDTQPPPPPPPPPAVDL